MRSYAGPASDFHIIVTGRLRRASSKSGPIFAYLATHLVSNHKEANRAHQYYQVKSHAQLQRGRDESPLQKLLQVEDPPSISVPYTLGC
jgi:hypothetical protein